MAKIDQPLWLRTMFSNMRNSLITGGTYYQVTGLPTEFDILHQQIAKGAFHDSAERFNPPRCLPGTRSALLSDITKWIKRSDRETYLLWLYGMVGSGKSALAQSIAELAHNQGILGASFFFAKNFEERSHEKRLAATIAYQLYMSIPELRAGIEATIRRDPSIFARAFQTQFRELVTQPLLSAIEISERHIEPHLVIIDGLDECYDHKVQCYIPNVIHEELQHWAPLPLIFIITSRPEEHLRLAFKSGEFARRSLRISLDDYFSLHDDIQMFLTQKFADIRENHPLKADIPAAWPSQHMLETLVLKSSGQFAYAATVIEYVGSAHGRPSDRLDIVLGLSHQSSDLPFSELDGLYEHIFSAVDNLKATLRIIGTIILLDLDISPAMLEKFLFLEPGDVYLHLRPLASIVTFQDSNQIIKIHHASFTDFLTDVSRSGKFYIESKDIHGEISACCLRHLRILDEPDLIDYACYNFEVHFEAAAAAQALHDELSSFEIGTLHKHRRNTTFMQSHSLEPILPLEDLWYFIPAFFNCLDNSSLFEDIQDILTEHLDSFDRYLEAEFEKYSVDGRLVDLVTMLTVHHSPIAVQTLDDGRLYNDLILRLDAGTEHLIMIDEASLNLRLMIRRHTQSDSYIELLCGYLEDHQRSGDHFINGKKYAKAAYRCFNSIARLSYNSGDELSHKALIWTLECIPPLLLHAAHDGELVSLLNAFDLKSDPRFSGNPYYFHFIAILQEVRLAYLIAICLEMKNASNTPLPIAHTHVSVIPQGLRLSSLQRFRNVAIRKWDDYLAKDAPDIARSVCCCKCLIAEYSMSRSSNGVNIPDKDFIIVHVGDPFPEFDPMLLEEEKSKYGTPTFDQVMQILAYKTWRGLMQDGS